jgi:penicillin V acylase-like amidase (Ntn superfamily)
MIKKLFLTILLVSISLVYDVEKTKFQNHKSVGTTFAVRAPKHSCTSICLVNDGYAVFATNYDHQIHEGLLFVNKRNVEKSYWEKTDPASESARWTSKYGSLTFNLVWNHHAWGGMNEEGLVISTMALDGSKSPAPDKRPWLYSDMWRQFILDNFKTVEEVIASDKLVRIKDFVEHFLVCDRTGNCAVIEFIDGKMVYYMGNTLHVKCLTNNTYEESIKSWKNNRLADPPGVRYKSSLLRFQIAADRVREFKPSDSESAVHYAFETLKAVEGSITQWSIVFDTQNMKIHFRTQTHSKIRTINLKKLDFSCKTPIKMLDIHEKLSGDITRKLKFYSSKLHFNHALHAWKRWGVDYDITELKQHIKFLEGYPCKKS